MTRKKKAWLISVKTKMNKTWNFGSLPFRFHGFLCLATADRLQVFYKTINNRILSKPPKKGGGKFAPQSFVKSPKDHERTCAKTKLNSVNSREQDTQDHWFGCKFAHRICFWEKVPFRSMKLLLTKAGEAAAKAHCYYTLTTILLFSQFYLPDWGESH